MSKKRKTWRRNFWPAVLGSRTPSPDQIVGSPPDWLRKPPRPPSSIVPQAKPPVSPTKAQSDNAELDRTRHLRREVDPWPYGFGTSIHTELRFWVNGPNFIGRIVVRRQHIVEAPAILRRLIGMNGDQFRRHCADRGWTFKEAR